MFINKRELEFMKDDIKHLERMHEIERTARWETEFYLRRLVDHLGLEQVTEPKVTKFVKKKAA